MDPRHLFMDQRLRGMCAYCGAQPDTRDHVPARVLLDEPFPAQLPVVDACTDCNAGFSLDEQYLACFLECVLAGTTDPTCVKRRPVSRMLREVPALRSRIAASRRTDDASGVVWQPEVDRVGRVVTKLARGHIAYELYAKHEDPVVVSFAPLPVLSESERVAFEEVPFRTPALWPEIGTRAFMRTLVVTDQGQSPILVSEGWIVVQQGRYRYAVESDGLMVRMVLSEYLACQVVWE